MHLTFLFSTAEAHCSHINSFGFLSNIRRSLHNNFVATLVRAFVADRVNYCVGLLAASPKKTTAKLQLVFSAAAQVMLNCGKYDRGLTHFRRHVLHWLDVTDRIRFRLCIHVYKCRHSMAPGYLIHLCHPVASIDGRGHL